MPWAGLRLAVTLLTAVPLPGQGAEPAGPSRRAAAAAMYWAPVVGLAVGAVGAGVLLLARLGHAGPLLGSALAVAAAAALTRALHLDGLADFADGLGSARPAGEALDIMKRSDIGPFGAVTLVLTLLVQIAALARADSLGRGTGAVLTAAVSARLAMTLACRTGVPAARPGGLGSLVAGTVRPIPAAVLTAVVLGAAAAGGLAPGTSGGWIFLAAAGAGLIVSVGVTALAVRRLGGITGDVLGALAEITATVCLVVTALS